MTTNDKASVSLCVLSVILCVTISITAQTLTEYYRTYEDFTKKRSTPLNELRQPPFVRVQSRGNRPVELVMIDSVGKTIEKHLYQYDKRDNLASVTVCSGRDRMTKFINYQPDSVQTRMISKINIDRWIPENEACYTETYYDSLTNPAEQRIYSYNGYLIGIITSDYVAGRLIRESIYKGEGAQLLEYTEFEFHLPDSVQTVRQFDGDGKLKSAASLRIYK